MPISLHLQPSYLALKDVTSAQINETEQQVKHFAENSSDNNTPQVEQGTAETVSKNNQQSGLHEYYGSSCLT